jgi:hypothetical protein
MRHALPAPNSPVQQTSSAVYGIDGDLDILVKPFNHETPALQILVNQSKGH